LQPDPPASFAGLFAAKEAIVKADNQYKNKPFHSIGIDHLPGGKPVHPPFEISITHTDSLAIAVAVRLHSTVPSAGSASPGNLPQALHKKNPFLVFTAVAAFLLALLAILLILFKAR
jgi:4'-phosphopantetheinyl transferase superfamily